jgi:hypothetical protein
MLEMDKKKEWSTSFFPNGMRFHQSTRVRGKINNKKSNISKQKLFYYYIYFYDRYSIDTWMVFPYYQYMSPYKIPHSVTLGEFTF